MIHKVIIQVSTNNPRIQTMALNNAVNLQKFYGVDNVKIEIVAFGLGIELLTKTNEQAHKIASLAAHGVTFNACMNAMRKIEEETGILPILAEGAITVTSGVAHIVELQEQGYSYIRP